MHVLLASYYFLCCNKALMVLYIPIYKMNLYARMWIIAACTDIIKGLTVCMSMHCIDFSNGNVTKMQTGSQIFNAFRE